MMVIDTNGLAFFLERLSYSSRGGGNVPNDGFLEDSLSLLDVGGLGHLERGFINADDVKSL